jgi:hypothetical protein
MMAKIKPDTPTNIIMCKLNFLGDRQVFQTRMGRLGSRFAACDKGILSLCLARRRHRTYSVEPEGVRSTV